MAFHFTPREVSRIRSAIDDCGRSFLPFACTKFVRAGEGYGVTLSSGDFVRVVTYLSNRAFRKAGVILKDMKEAIGFSDRGISTFEMTEEIAGLHEAIDICLMKIDFEALKAGTVRQIEREEK
ncbi:MAG: hypothetical protein ACI4SY_01990 [Sutterella sp.]